MKIFINGRFVDKKDAVISVFDRGFLYGDGLFETLISYDGVAFLASEHMKRLARSADLLRINVAYSSDELIGIMHEALRINRLTSAYIRITVSRGVGEIGLSVAGLKASTVVVMAKKFTPLPAEHYENGVRIALVDVIRNLQEALDPSIKSANFLNNIAAKMQAEEAGAFEGIMLNSKGFITEGSISNIFFVKKTHLYTPVPAAGILKGITRRSVISLAKKLGIPVTEGLFLPDELRHADEVFVTNSSMEILPVAYVDEHMVGNGVPGRITTILAAAYKKLVASETAAAKKLLGL